MARDQANGWCTDQGDAQHVDSNQGACGAPAAHGPASSRQASTSSAASSGSVGANTVGSRACQRDRALEMGPCGMATSHRLSVFNNGRDKRGHQGLGV